LYVGELDNLWRTLFRTGSLIVRLRKKKSIAVNGGLQVTFNSCSVLLRGNYVPWANVIVVLKPIFTCLGGNVDNGN